MNESHLISSRPCWAYTGCEQQACSSALTGDAHALPISALEQESGISLRVDCVAPPDIPLSAHRSVMQARKAPLIVINIVVK
jgi:hypothetical protein